MRIFCSGIKKNLSIWVFAITLLVSIFSFFNDTANYSPTRQRIVKNELPGSRFKTAKRSIPYPLSFSSSPAEINFSQALRWDEYFERKIKVRLTNNLKTFFFRARPILYHRTLLHNPDKEDIDSIRG